MRRNKAKKTWNNQNNTDKKNTLVVSVTFLTNWIRGFSLVTTHMIQ
ncbi:7824_t:CDS:2 [Cetraspora pellucida]|uniref:7824_t:CDS:1 n=1 Tax=Cetraspora pellucida TaxID=1433469 RepID=A0A9N8Z8X6_9GLOM|nr:7824_t:CDS:2 [Cetraspora pellucida]